MSGNQAPVIQLMLLTDLIARWAPGSQNADWDWDDEYEWCWDHHETVMADLAADIARNGIREPVLLGNDGRVWDGHHRICAAMHLFLTEVPVIHAHEQQVVTLHLPLPIDKLGRLGEVLDELWPGCRFRPLPSGHMAVVIREATDG